MSYETSPDTSQQWNTMCIESNQKGLQQYSTLSTVMRKQQAENDQVIISFSISIYPSIYLFNYLSICIYLIYSNTFRIYMYNYFYLYIT